MNLQSLLIGGVALIAAYVVATEYLFKKNISEQPAENQKSEQSTMSFFITSSNLGKGGNLGGLAGADAYCSTLASSAGVTGKTWRAYLSTTQTEGAPAVHARDRIGTGPWFNAEGKKMADTVDSLHAENNLNKSTALSEKGEIINGRGDTPNVHDILTGSLADGRASTTAQTDTTCSNWTSSDAGSALVGHHDRVGRDDSAPMKSWNTAHASRGCSIDALKSTGGGGLFYCFAAE
jgi:hypothetical protein